MFGCFYGIEQLHEALAFFLYIFPTQKNKGGNAGANAQKQ
jgi:hypothetical protein